MRTQISSLPLAITLAWFAACGRTEDGGEGNGLNIPQDLSYPMPSAMYLVGVPITPNRPTVEGDIADWSVTPALPPGLVFDTDLGGIEGTPTEPSPARMYRVEARNPAGFVTLDLRLGVERPPHFFLAGNAEDQSLSLFTVDAFDGRLEAGSFLRPDDGDLGASDIVDIVQDGNRAWALLGQPSRVLPIHLEREVGRLTPGTPTPIS
jgi:hypothetical protein